MTEVLSLHFKKTPVYFDWKVPNKCKGRSRILKWGVNFCNNVREIKYYFNIWGIRKKRKKEGASEKGGVKIHPFHLPWIRAWNGPPLLTLKSWESWIEDTMTSKTHQFKNAMRVYAPKLICSTGVSSFQTFKRVFCMYSELRLHAAILSFDVILYSIQPSEVQQRIR